MSLCTGHGGVGTLAFKAGLSLMPRAAVPALATSGHCPEVAGLHGMPGFLGVPNIVPGTDVPSPLHQLSCGSEKHLRTRNPVCLGPTV